MQPVPQDAVAASRTAVPVVKPEVSQVFVLSPLSCTQASIVSGVETTVQAEPSKLAHWAAPSAKASSAAEVRRRSILVDARFKQRGGVQRSGVQRSGVMCNEGFQDAIFS